MASQQQTDSIKGTRCTRECNRNEND